MTKDDYIKIGKIFYVDDYFEVDSLFSESGIREEIEDIFDGEIYYWEDIKGMPMYYREIDGNFDLELYPDFWVKEIDDKLKVVLEGIYIKEIDYDIKDTYFYESVIEPRYK